MVARRARIKKMLAVGNEADARITTKEMKSREANFYLFVLEFSVGRTSAVKNKKMVFDGKICKSAPDIYDKYLKGSTVRVIYYADDPRYCELLEIAQNTAPIAPHAACALILAGAFLLIGFIVGMKHGAPIGVLYGFLLGVPNCIQTLYYPFKPFGNAHKIAACSCLAVSGIVESSPLNPAVAPLNPTMVAQSQPQIFTITIPADVGPGQQFQVNSGGQMMTIACPLGCGPGSQVQIAAPAIPVVVGVAKPNGNKVTPTT
jgi:hypothetical protein